MTLPRPRTLAWGLLLLALLAAAGFFAASALRHEVATARPARGGVVQAFYSTGTVSPERDFPVRTQVTGTVKRMLVDKGSPVTKGQLLAVVEDPRLAFAVASAEAQVREASALADESSSPALAEFDGQLAANIELTDIARREVDRQQKAVDLSASSRADLDRALDRLKLLVAERGTLTARRATTLLALRRQLDVARAQLDAARAEFDKQSVFAPADGVVLDRPTPFGTRVDAAMSNHLMTVADVSQSALVMRAQVDEEDVAGVSVGQTVKMTLYAFGEEVFDGVVKRLYDRADEARRTFEVDVTIDPRGRRLSAGMTGELAFILREKADALVLPASTLQIRIRPRRDGERPANAAANSAAAQAQAQADEVRETVVWTVRDGRLRPVPVTPGLRSLERVEIVEGLTEDDLAVTSPIDPRTPEGTRVRAKPPAPLPDDRISPPTTQKLSRTGTTEAGGH